MSPAGAGPLWPEHPADTPVIATNLAALHAELDAARGDRSPFDLAIPLSWHRRIYDGCSHVPFPLMVGNYRSNADPQLQVTVTFGRGFQGEPPGKVPGALALLEADLQRRLASLDALVDSDGRMTNSRARILMQIAADAYAEWIRIHPFADGNGRTARTLVNWLMARYDQPPILPGRPPADVQLLTSATEAAIVPNGDARALQRHFTKRLASARASSSTT